MPIRSGYTFTPSVSALHKEVVMFIVRRRPLEDVRNDITKESLEQNITDLEIDAMEKEQAITDLEIDVMELKEIIHGGE